MIFPINHKANWQLIKNRKQELIDKNNERENTKCMDYDYKVGEKVLIYTPDPNKMEQPREGHTQSRKYIQMEQSPYRKVT
jgi:hypothetical protein